MRVLNAFVNTAFRTIKNLISSKDSMKLHFNDLFLHRESQVFPRFDVTSSGTLYRKGEGFPETDTIFGIPYATLLNHDFEVADLPGSGYEIKAYYVR